MLRVNGLLACANCDAALAVHGGTWCSSCIAQESSERDEATVVKIAQADRVAALGEVPAIHTVTTRPRLPRVEPPKYCTCGDYWHGGTTCSEDIDPVEEDDDGEPA